MSILIRLPFKSIFIKIVILFISSLAWAEEIKIANQIQLFSKESISSIVTTKIYEWPPIFQKIELPVNNIQVQKIFEEISVFQEIHIKIQIFYHQKSDMKYFSQQILITKEQLDIAFCTSYFNFNNDGLVPGACIGFANPIYLGVAIYKK